MKETACKGGCISSALKIMHGIGNAGFLIHNFFFKKLASSTISLYLIVLQNITWVQVCFKLAQTCTHAVV